MLDLLTPEQLQELLAGSIFTFISMFFSSLLALGVYLITAFSMYSMAKRRCIAHAWLAWIPVGNLWILGAIADDYRLRAHGAKKARRKVLLGLSIAVAVLAVLIVVLCVCMVVQLLANTDPVTGELTGDLLETAGFAVIGLVVLYLPMMVLIILQTVFQYIAYYELFASCDPRHAVVYLVLSIIFQVTLPVFLFVCRNKDYGLPILRYKPATEPWQQPGQ